jgi:hypothetical protein
MRLTTTRLWVPILTVAICLSASSARAQQQGSQTNPVPPAGSAAPPQGQQNKTQEPASPVAASPNPITGALAPLFGEGGESRSTLLFGVHANELADSNPIGNSGSSWAASTDVGAHLQLHVARRSSDFSLSYTGGAYIYDQNQFSQFNSSYHAFSVAEVINFRRVTLHLNDEFAYLPESPLGFGGGGFGGLLGGFSLINPNVVPDQSALTLQSQRLSNTLVAEADITTSARSSWTITGSYGILHYIQAGFLQPSSYTFGVGYNRTLSARHTIGINYRLNLLRFNPNLSSINDHSFQVNYGYQTGGRLSFQAGAGPDFTSFQLLGSTATTSRISWSANAGVSYLYTKTAVQFSAYRSVGGGAGIFLGAETNGVQFSATRPISRFWTIYGSAGFQDDQALSQTVALSSSFQSLYFTVSASRNVSRTGSLFTRYSFQHEFASGTACNGFACIAPFTRHQISVGFSWDMRPMPLR